MLRYHAKTCELLRDEPAVDAAMMPILSQVEERLGRVLPASLREWYSLSGAVEILKRCTFLDPPVEPAELGLDWHGRRSEFVDQGLLVIGYENQGVCTWAVDLNDGDDPRVVVDYDTDFREPNPCTPSFSAFVHAGVWDTVPVWARAGPGPDVDLCVMAQNDELSPDALAALRSMFEAGPLTHGFPGHTQYRFVAPGGRILIWAADGQADWHIVGGDEEALERIVEAVWHLDSVGKSLYAVTPDSKSILESVRSRGIGGSAR